MDMDIPRNFELRIIHDFGKSEPNAVHCTVLPLDQSLDAGSGEAILHFETVLHNLEYVLGLSDSRLIEIMDDYVRSGCSRFVLTTTPAKLRDAGLHLGN